MAEERPLDRSPYYVEHFEHFDRALRRPHLAGIGISGVIGAGIFISSGALITTSGSVGGPLSYIIAGGIVACVMYTLSEMVACRPLTGALIDFPHTFVEPALGFAVAASYSLANICSMVTLTQQSTEIAGLLRSRPERFSPEKEVGLNFLFIGLTTFSHCLGVQIYGKIERVIMWFKFCLIVLVCTLMIVVNAKRAHPFYENYTSNAFTPWFNPAGFDSTSPNANNFDIVGPRGGFVAFLTSVSLAIFSCMGGDLVIMAAGEAKNPWEDLPAVTSFVYLIPLSLYPFILFAAGANVNYADPLLPHTWRRVATSRFQYQAPSQSPFVIAVQSILDDGLPTALNAFFLISAYTTANTALYVSSRAVFMLSQTYMPNRVANILGRTNNGHTPLAAILLCSALGLLSLISVIDDRYSQPKLVLSEFYTGSIACIYICECLAFLRFKTGLDRLANLKILSRNDSLYIENLFKSRWQPLPAYIGIIGCSFVIIWSGIPALYILGARHRLGSLETLKESKYLAFDVVGVYIGPLLFLAFYLTYKYIHPRSHLVDIRDLTVDKYILPDVNSFERENPIDGTGVMDREPDAHIELDEREGMPEHEDIDDDTATDATDAESDAYDGRQRQRSYVLDVLRRRGTKQARSVWRELWSFVVADKD